LGNVAVATVALAAETVRAEPPSVTVGLVEQMLAHSPVPLMFIEVGRPLAEYVVYTAVITGTALAIPATPQSAAPIA
jgi:hypothetical protein